MVTESTFPRRGMSAGARQVAGSTTGLEARPTPVSCPSGPDGYGSVVTACSIVRYAPKSTLTPRTAARATATAASTPSTRRTQPPCTTVTTSRPTAPKARATHIRVIGVNDTPYRSWTSPNHHTATRPITAPTATPPSRQTSPRTGCRERRPNAGSSAATARSPAATSTGTSTDGATTATWNRGRSRSWNMGPPGGRCNRGGGPLRTGHRGASGSHSSHLCGSQTALDRHPAKRPVRCRRQNARWRAPRVNG